jgi:hypothetical protein
MAQFLVKFHLAETVHKTAHRTRALILQNGHQRRLVNILDGANHTVREHKRDLRFPVNDRFCDLLPLHF